MRKVLFLIILILPSALSALSWSPSLSVAAGCHGTEFFSSYDSSSDRRVSALISAKFDIPALSFSKHRISMPVSINYITSSNENERVFIPHRAEAVLSFSYTYFFSGKFALETSIDARFSYFCQTESSYWRFGLTSEPKLSPVNHFSFVFPLSLIFGRAEISVGFGIGTEVYL